MGSRCKGRYRDRLERQYKDRSKGPKIHHARSTLGLIVHGSRKGLSGVGYR